MIKQKFFLSFIFFCNFFCITICASTQSVIKEEVIDLRFNNTDIRFIVHATKEEDIAGKELDLLEEFVNLEKRIAVIFCNKHNIDFMVNKINAIQGFFPVRRYYNNVPMLLNERAASLLPRLNEQNQKLSAFTVLLITLTEGHKRLVFVKGKKSYAQNVAGATESEDYRIDDQDTIFQNTACRELSEEINLSITSDKLCPIGMFKFMAEKRLIDTQWTNLFVAFYAHLDKEKTDQWLEKIGMNIDHSVLCNSKRVTDNSETQWIFFVKPKMFKSHNILFSLDNEKLSNYPRFTPMLLLR